MIKKLSIILLILILSTPCFAATKQVMGTGTPDNFNGVSTEYYPMTSVGTSAWSTTEYTVVWPAAGTITDLCVELDSTTGAGNTSTWTVRLNKATPGTPTQAIITNSTNDCDTTATTIAAGDEVSIQQVPTSAPSTSDPSWSIVWNPTTADYTVIVGGTMANTLATSGTEYLPMHGTRTPESSAFEVSTLFPTGGTLRDMYIELGTDPGAGTTRIFTYGALTCTVVGGEGTTCNSSALTQAVTANDVYTLTSTVTGTPAASIVSYGVVFVPTTSGQFTFHGSTDDALSTNDEFCFLSTAGTGTTPDGAGHWTGTTTTRECLSSIAFTMKNIYFESAVDIGLDTDLYNLYFRADEANSALTCQLTGAGAGPWRCNASSDISVTAGQELSVAVTDDATTPSGGSSRWAFTGFITPTGGAARRVITVQ